MASARIAKEKNGSYTVRLKVKRPDGRWGTDTKRGFRRKADAEAYRTEQLARIDGAAYVRPSRVTVGQFGARWLPTIPATHAPATVASYRHWWGRFEERFRHREVSSLQPDDVEAWVAELAAGDSARKPVSATSAGYGLAVVKIALKQAVVWGIVNRNVASLVKAPRSDTAERQIWSPAEIKAFLAHVETDRDYVAWRLMLTTGMRLGEVAGLEVADIDLDVARLRVHQTRTVVRGRVMVGAPKTAKSRRVVNLDAKTVEVIRRHLETRELELQYAGSAWQGSSLLLVDEIGRGVHPNHIRRRFARLVAGAGLQRIGVHDCRHSYITAALASGTPILEVSRRVGHANVSVTLNRYGHLLPGQDAAVASAVAALIDQDEG